MDAEIVEKARTILQEEGWIRGESFRPGQGYCLSGALHKAGSQLDKPHTDVCDIERWITDYFFDHHYDIVDFNDLLVRRVEDVDDLLCRASKEMRRETE